MTPAKRNCANLGFVLAASAAKIWYSDWSSALEGVFPGIFDDFLSPFILTKTRCFNVNHFHMWQQVRTYTQICIFTNKDVHVWYQHVDQAFTGNDVTNRMLDVYTNVSIDIFVHVDIYISISQYVYKYMYTHICVNVYVYIYLYIYVYVYIYIYTYIPTYI